MLAAMLGIKGYGVHLPRYRLPRACLKSQWGEGDDRGERTVANHDEDALTMAFAAAERCLSAGEAGLSAVYFASASPPYSEKSCAAALAAALDLEEETTVLDLSASLRAGAGALRAALDAVGAGSAGEALVAIGECRLAPPGHPREGWLGDAGAAFWLGKENVIASVDCRFALTRDFFDVWRREGERFLRFEDPKFVQEKGYLSQIKRAWEGLLSKQDINAGDICRVACAAPDPITRRALPRALGLDPEAFAGRELLDLVGYAGNAAPFLSLAAALEEARPSEKIVLLAYGDGAEALLLTVQEGITAYRPLAPLSAQLARRKELESYAKYLRFRHLLDEAAVDPFAPYPLIHREQRANLSRYGSRCNRCGAFSFPPRRICRACNAKDDFREERLSRFGTVVTFAKDHLYPSPDPPTVMASADMEGGGRFYTQMTDVTPDEVEIGMKVELTLRRLHGGGGRHNYFWKFLPAG